MQTQLGLRFVPSPSEQLRQPGLMGALSIGCGVPYSFRVPALVSALDGRVRLVSVLGSWSLAVTLPADVNHPESQEVFG